MTYHMKIKVGDLVLVRIGKHKGETAKVEKVLPAKRAVVLEGIGKVKRHIRPSQINPRGGTRDIQIPLSVSKVALVVDGKVKTSRTGVNVTKDGSKIRIARKLKNKEI